MTPTRRVVLSGMWLVLCACLGCGCNMLPHSLQPHQLQKLNRGPAPFQQEFFSVSDPIPEVS